MKVTNIVDLTVSVLFVPAIQEYWGVGYLPDLSTHR